MAATDRPSSSPSSSRGKRLPGAGGDKSLPELGRELLDLTVTYAKQETIDPLRTIGRRVGMGVLGSGVASVGLVFLLVGVLRLLQVEVALRGAWSFVPYVAAILVAGAVALLALKQIGAGRGR